VSVLVLLLLDSESDSKLNRFGPPPWLGRPCWSPKVVAKGKDVLGHLWSLLHMFGASSNLGLGPMCGKQARDDIVMTHLYLEANNGMYMWNHVNCIRNHYVNVRTKSPYNQCSYPKVSCPHHSPLLDSKPSSVWALLEDMLSVVSNITPLLDIYHVSLEQNLGLST
jgi:hypothetical protein